MIGEVDVITCVADQPRQESSFGSTGALPKRMQLVGHAIEVYELLYEFIVRQSFEIIAVFEALEDQLSPTFNVFRKGKLRSFLADIHCADLPGPIV